MFFFGLVSDPYVNCKDNFNWGESKGCLIKGCLNLTKILKVGIPKPGLPKLGIPKTGFRRWRKPTLGLSPRQKFSKARDSEVRDSESIYSEAGDSENGQILNHDPLVGQAVPSAGLSCY